jgi:hypothetical protein
MPRCDKCNESNKFVKYVGLFERAIELIQFIFIGCN